MKGSERAPERTGADGGTEAMFLAAEHPISSPVYLFTPMAAGTLRCLVGT